MCHLHTDGHCSPNLLETQCFHLDVKQNGRECRPLWDLIFQGPRCWTTVPLHLLQGVELAQHNNIMSVTHFEHWTSLKRVLPGQGRGRVLLPLFPIFRIYVWCWNGTSDVMRHICWRNYITTTEPPQKRPFLWPVTTNLSFKARGTCRRVPENNLNQQAKGCGRQ